jgi:hypothetical protein
LSPPKHLVAPNFCWTLQGVDKYFPVCALAPRLLRHLSRTMLHCPPVSLTVICGFRKRGWKLQADRRVDIEVIGTRIVR